MIPGPRQLARIAALGLTARQIVEGLSTGRHRSPHKGFSVEFRQHRSYVPGDELRSIDWKAFGKSDRLYIREYDDETNLRCHLLVDRSGSMLYAGDRSRGPGGKPISKLRYAQTLAAAVAHLMIQSQDQVGVLTFDSSVRDVVPCRGRGSHLRAILAALTRTGDHGQTDLAAVVTAAAAKIGRRGLVVLITDGGGDIEALAESLALLRSRKHEIILFQISDPDEIDLDLGGRIRFEDLEGRLADQTIDVRDIGAAYRQRRAEFDRRITEVCRRNRVDRVAVSTDVDVGEMLAEYLSRRRSVGSAAGALAETSR